MGFPLYWTIIINFIESVQYQGLIKTLKDDPMVIYMFFCCTMILFVMITNALLVMEESKILSLLQLSVGPKKAAPFGKFQPFADAIKLILKEYMSPNQTESFLYKVIAQWGFFIALGFWYLAPFVWELAISHGEVSVFMSFLISILHAYAMLLSGWSSKSKYSFLGALSSTAQMMAYDIVIVLVYLNVYIYTGDFSFLSIVHFQEEHGALMWFLPLQFIVFFMASLAETSSHPFDLPEAEPELVSGYNVEYSSMSFALFFLTEYANVLFLALLMNTIFLSGSNYFFFFTSFESLNWILKMSFLIFMIMKISGLLPSYSYDQLMALGWKCLIPFEMSTLFINIFTQIFF